MKNIHHILLLTSGISFLTPFYLYPQADIHTNGTSVADSSLTSGREMYMKNCAGCHGQRGQGFAGPNLTDNYWLHGGTRKDVMTSIEDGIPSKGMIGWKIVYSSGEVEKIADYLHSLRGTNPPKAKKPEGALHND